MLDQGIGNSMISIYNINNGNKEPTPPVSTLCYKSNIWYLVGTTRLATTSNWLHITKQSWEILPSSTEDALLSMGLKKHSPNLWPRIVKFIFTHLQATMTIFPHRAVPNRVWVFDGIFVFDTIWVYIPCKNLCINIIEGELYGHWIYNSENPHFDNEKDIYSCEHRNLWGKWLQAHIWISYHLTVIAMCIISYKKWSACREKSVHLRPNSPYSTRTPVQYVLNQQKDKSSRLFPKRHRILQSRTENCSKWKRSLAIVLSKDNCHTSGHTADWQFWYRDIDPNAKKATWTGDDSMYHYIH